MTSRLTDKIAKALLNPIRDNDLEQRRKALKLSRAALARILGVNEATVFRDRKSTRLNSSHRSLSRMPSSA